MKNNSYRTTAYIFTFVLGVFSNGVFAEDQAKLLVLGSAHFSATNLDSINVEVADILSEQRQTEIEALVDQLVKFNPTHIAVEFPSKYQTVLDDRYLNYQNGRYELDRRESDQIGLRLAAKLGHERIYAVDWNDSPPGDIEADYNWNSYGLANGHEATIAKVTDPQRAKEFYVELKEQSIITWMKQLNQPKALAASHRMYFDIATIGDGENLIGANWVGTWYARNLKIFTRLINLAENSDDRILIIYGQGHAYLLQQFARESGAFELISVDSVLTQ